MVRECTEEPAKIKWASTNVIEFQWLSSFLLASMTASTNNITEFCGIRFLRPHFFLFRSAFYLFKYAIDQRELCSSLYNFVFFSLPYSHLVCSALFPFALKLNFYRATEGKKPRAQENEPKNARTCFQSIAIFSHFILSHWRILSACSRYFYCIFVQTWTMSNVATTQESHTISSTHSTEISAM